MPGVIFVIVRDWTLRLSALDSHSAVTSSGTVGRSVGYATSPEASSVSWVGEGLLTVSGAALLAVDEIA